MKNMDDFTIEEFIKNNSSNMGKIIYDNNQGFNFAKAYQLNQKKLNNSRKKHSWEDQKYSQLKKQVEEEKTFPYMQTTPNMQLKKKKIYAKCTSTEAISKKFSEINLEKITREGTKNGIEKVLTDSSSVIIGKFGYVKCRTVDCGRELSVCSLRSYSHVPFEKLKMKLEEDIRHFLKRHRFSASLTGTKRFEGKVGNDYLKEKEEESKGYLDDCSSNNLEMDMDLRLSTTPKNRGKNIDKSTIGSLITVTEDLNIEEEENCSDTKSKTKSPFIIKIKGRTEKPNNMNKQQVKPGRTCDNPLKFREQNKKNYPPQNTLGGIGERTEQTRQCCSIKSQLNPNITSSDLTPIPTRKTREERFNSGEYIEAERAAVLVRRIEYSNSMKTKHLANTKETEAFYLKLLMEAKTIMIQKCWRSWLARMRLKNAMAAIIQKVFKGRLRRKEFRKWKNYKLRPIKRLVEIILMKFARNYFKKWYILIKSLIRIQAVFRGWSFRNNKDRIYIFKLLKLPHVIKRISGNSDAFKFKKYLFITKLQSYAYSKLKQQHEKSSNANIASLKIYDYINKGFESKEFYLIKAGQRKLISKLFVIFARKLLQAHLLANKIKFLYRISKEKQNGESSKRNDQLNKILTNKIKKCETLLPEYYLNLWKNHIQRAKLDISAGIIVKYCRKVLEKINSRALAKKILQPFRIKTRKKQLIDIALHLNKSRRFFKHIREHIINNMLMGSFGKIKKYKRMKYLGRVITKGFSHMLVLSFLKWKDHTKKVHSGCAVIQKNFREYCNTKILKKIYKRNRCFQLLANRAVIKKYSILKFFWAKFKHSTGVFLRKQQKISNAPRNALIIKRQLNAYPRGNPKILALSLNIQNIEEKDKPFLDDGFLLLANRFRFWKNRKKIKRLKYALMNIHKGMGPLALFPSMENYMKLYLTKWRKVNTMLNINNGVLKIQKNWRFFWKNKQKKIRNANHNKLERMVEIFDDICVHKKKILNCLLNLLTNKNEKMKLIRNKCFIKFKNATKIMMITNKIIRLQQFLRNLFQNRALLARFQIQKKLWKFCFSKIMKDMTRLGQFVKKGYKMNLMLFKTIQKIYLRKYFNEMMREYNKFINYINFIQTYFRYRKQLVVKRRIKEVLKVYVLQINLNRLETLRIFFSFWFRYILILKLDRSVKMISRFIYHRMLIRKIRMFFVKKWKNLYVKGIVSLAQISRGKRK